LTVSANGGVQIFDRDELLARTDVVEITTSRDVAYRTPRTYRAVALAKLFEGGAIPPDGRGGSGSAGRLVTQLSREPMLLSGLAATADVDIERVQFAPFAFDPFSAFDIAQVPLIFCAPLDLQAAGARRQISAPARSR
jgi:hypothetical protein